MSIGQRIKTMRKQRGLSIDDLAVKLDKNRTTVYRYETGDIENLPLGILDSLANALNTTPAYLMGWEDENTLHPACNHEIELTYREKWHNELNDTVFSDEEHEKIIEYAKFLISIRDQ